MSTQAQTPHHPQPNQFVVSVDCVIFAYANGAIQLPLLQRAIEPFADCWSLPGGPILHNETPEDACLRKLQQDIGLQVEHLEQLFTFGSPNRDPRNRAFSISHIALIQHTERPLSWGPDTHTAKWFNINQLPQSPWAFDHAQIVQLAIERLRSKLTYEPIGMSLLPTEFSLPELKNIYEVILGKELDRRNFYKKIKATGLLIPTKTVPSKRGKPTQLHRFDKQQYNRLKQAGFAFEI